MVFALFFVLCLTLNQAIAQDWKKNYDDVSGDYNNTGVSKVVKDGKYGYVNAQTGSEIIKPQFNFGEDFIKDIAIVELNKKKALINSKGKLITDFIYYRLSVKDQYGDTWVESRSEDRLKGIITLDGRELAPCIYEEIFHEHYFIVRKNGLYGIMNRNGALILPTVSKSLPKYSAPFFRVGENEAVRGGLIDTMGNQVLAYHGDIFNGTSTEYFIAKNSLKYAIVDKTAKQLFALECEEAQGFFDNLAKVKLGGKWGFMDITGNMVVKPQFDKADGFFNGRAVVHVGDKCGALNEKGELIIPLVYQRMTSFKNDVAFIYERRGDKWYYGLIDKNGKQLAPIEFNNIIEAGNKQYHVTKDGKHGILDNTGKIIVPARFNSITGLGNGNYLVNADNKIGVIDATGRIVIEPFYNMIGEFTNDIAIAQRDDRFGLINSKGEVRLAFNYTVLSSADSGLYIAATKDGYFYLNRSLKEMFTAKYDSIGTFSEGLAWVRTKGKYGYIDKTGKLVIPLKYSSVQNFMQSKAYVEADSMVWVIDKTGKQLKKVEKKTPGELLCMSKFERYKKIITDWFTIADNLKKTVLHMDSTISATYKYTNFDDVKAVNKMITEIDYDYTAVPVLMKKMIDGYNEVKLLQQEITTSWTATPVRKAFYDFASVKFVSLFATENVLLNELMGHLTPVKSYVENRIFYVDRYLKSKQQSIAADKEDESAKQQKWYESFTSRADKSSIPGFHASYNRIMTQYNEIN